MRLLSLLLGGSGHLQIGERRERASNHTQEGIVVLYGMVWYDMVWYGYGMVWYGMVRCGMVK